jgi:hypothetical protein
MVMPMQLSDTSQNYLQYHGYRHFQDTEDGLWKVILDKNTVFVIALDDSKLCGLRRIIWKMNTEAHCKRFIDLLIH